MVFLTVVGVLYAYGAIYFIALSVALLQAIWHVWLIRNRERDACFKAFRLNHWYGFAVFLGVFLHYLIL
jgi:4-hydroxybenzoate polyprenyltransferase